MLPMDPPPPALAKASVLSTATVTMRNATTIVNPFINFMFDFSPFLSLSQRRSLVFHHNIFFGFTPYFSPARVQLKAFNIGS
jgi:hypothetical protein